MKNFIVLFGCVIIFFAFFSVHKSEVQTNLSITGWSALGEGVNGTINVVAVNGNDVYVGGFFTMAGGIPANRIAKWDGTTWTALDSGLNGTVFEITVNGNDVYVGGQFTTAGSITANRIAKWDGTTWSTFGDGVNNIVRAIAIDGDDIYVGGQFTIAGEIPANRIAKWDGASWSPLDSGVIGAVNVITINGNDLYVGGPFTSASGVPGTNRIAKWNGTNWSALGNGVGSPNVNAIVIKDNDIYVGGTFNTPSNNIAKWNGTTWSSLGLGVNSTVHSIIVKEDDLYIGGNFTGTTLNRIAKWNGTAWSSVGNGVNNTIQSLALSGNYIYAGGQFTIAGTDSAFRIAKWTEPPPPPPDNLIASITAIGTVELSWNNTSTNFDGIVIERKDNIDTNWTSIDTIFGNASQYIDSNLQIGRIYYWRIFVFNAVGNSAYSNEVSAIITNHSAMVENLIPDKFLIHQNFPNPFNPSTRIKFELLLKSHVNISVFDMQGREIAVLVDEVKNQGIFEVEWNASYLPSGIYFYKINADDFLDAKKMILLK